MLERAWATGGGDARPGLVVSGGFSGFVLDNLHHYWWDKVELNCAMPRYSPWSSMKDESGGEHNHQP